MQEPHSKLKHKIVSAMMTAVAFVFLVGCRPDKDVTTDPYYNFSSFAGTVWKTKTKTAIVETKGYSGGPRFMLLPPRNFDPTDTNYMGKPDVKSIAALPLGTRLRITRLLQANDWEKGNSYGVEAVVEDGTKAPKAVYLDQDFLTNVWWASKGPTSNTNWGVDPDMLAAFGDSGLSTSSSPEISDTPQAGYEKGYANGKERAILANNALPQNKQAAIKGLSDPWLGLESRPVAMMIYGEDYVAEYESGCRKGFHDYFEKK